jgi:single-strand DNA-binding protein
MLSKAMLIGNLGKNPEIRQTNNGKTVASFSIATENGYGDNKKTFWWNIISFDENLINKVIQPYTTKGTKVFIEGDLQNRKYEKDGKEKWVTEVVIGFGGVLKLLGNKEGKPASNNGPLQQDDLDDDIPFDAAPSLR